MQNNKQIILAGYIGLLASILVGAGEFLLHFDVLGRFAGQYGFMLGIEAKRSTLGHFIGVLAAPLYIVGYWHLMKMIEPANKTMAKVAFGVMSYGIFMGAIWIASRASISAIVNDATLIDTTHLISLYELRYETLLNITRVAVLIFSAIFIWLILSGKTHYPKWVAAFNPLVLILASFAIWMLLPAIGVYLMPIALNIAFAIVFAISLSISHKQNKELK
jgi:hypothetical protein